MPAAPSPSSRTARVSRNIFLWRSDDFAAAGLRPEVAAAIEKRAGEISGACSDCGAPATWLWISRREVSSLDQTERIENSSGALFCARHGAAKLCDALGKVQEANLFYVNAPVRGFRRVPVDLKP